ncbi:MAG: TRIC cation channel family protein [Cellulomonadaceae bacterium]|nr:TRIC cation channel family protein [Cellulomonadaceae bacterium]
MGYAGAPSIQEVVAALPLGYVWELAAISIAGLAGGIAGIRKGFDLFGVLVLAWTTSLFGGVLRDVMIGALPPVGIANWRFFVSAISGGLASYFLVTFVKKINKAIIVLDAFALGLFVWVGTLKGLEYGMGLLASAVVGVLTGVGGGLVRDLLTNRVPLVLSDRQYYAIPACCGAGAFVGLFAIGQLNIFTSIIVMMGIVAFRLVALKLKWHVPTPQHWEPHRPHK